MNKNKFTGYSFLSYLLVLLVLSTQLSGCAQTRMVNRFNPQANFYGDQAACQQLALAKHPDVVLAVTPSAAQFTTNCQRVGAQTQCTTRQIDTSAQDRNSAQIQQGILNGGRGMSRALEVGSCMAERGWVSERVN
jgi:hypothetical protein